MGGRVGSFCRRHPNQHHRQNNGHRYPNLIACNHASDLVAQ
ncbi:MAG TPA: hypothetical protein VFI81_02390 [Rhodanobacteraceae bacterium]|nr:hypothetical protein [Rhodanobacteraceae bacterium]